VVAQARKKVKKAKTAEGGSGRRRSMNRVERRQHILTAARDVFAKRGYHQTTIDEIVAEAGLARGTFYLYFEDKRAVFADLIDRFFTQLTMVIQRIDTGDDAPPVDQQAKENIRRILRTCLAERAMTKILFTDALGIDSAFDRKLLTFYDAVVQLLTESLREGQALGIVADGEPRVLSYMTVGALKELLYQAVTLGLSEESAEALTQQLYDFVSKGFLRVEGPPARRPPRRAPRAGR
jgi:AcrR family transcriptional regulator